MNGLGCGYECVKPIKGFIFSWEMVCIRLRDMTGETFRKESKIEVLVLH